jgi:cytoskeletal protein CcmA (bactofilin family)
MNHEDNSNSMIKRTVVEEGTRFKGDLVSTCPVDVRGRIEGEIQAPSLTVSARGAVHGRAKVGSVRSEGELSGEFEADTVELSGVVCDKTVIRARSLEVKLTSAKGQQIVFGDCELSIGDEPSEYDALVEPAATDAALLAEEPRPDQAPLSEPAPVAAAEAEPEPDEELTDDAAASLGSEAPESGRGDLQVEHKTVHSSIAEALASETASEDKPNGGEASSGWSQPPPAE